MQRINSIESLEKRQLFAADIGFSMESFHVDSTALVATFEASITSPDDVDAAFADDLDDDQPEEKKEEKKKTPPPPPPRPIAAKAYNKMMSYISS